MVWGVKGEFARMDALTRITHKDLLAVVVPQGFLLCFDCSLWVPPLLVPLPGRRREGPVVVDERGPGRR